MSAQPLHHLIDIESTSLDSIRRILTQAEHFSKNNRMNIGKIPNDKEICMAFFEPSTRTRCSFEIAAKRLGLKVIHFDAGSSSTKKGETLLDTFQALSAMGIDAFVVRHSDSGTPQFLADHLPSNVSIINAGDGHHAHPTQALLDVFTIQQHKPKIDSLSVAIVGDISHSRVARSQVALLQKLGVNDIRLIAPKSLLPADLHGDNLSHFTDLNQGIKDVDVVIALRIQTERMEKIELPNLSDYFQQYGIKSENLRLAKKDAIVLHPGPINRDIDIASDVADGSQSVILEQITNGVFVRTAVLDLIFKA